MWKNKSKSRRKHEQFSNFSCFARQSKPRSSYGYTTKLDKISEDKLASLAFLDLKNPAISQVLAITLGGAAVDRFYRGQIGWGLLKIFTFGGMGIWAIIDMFLTAKGTRKDNFNKINSILSSY